MPRKLEVIIKGGRMHGKTSFAGALYNVLKHFGAQVTLDQSSMYAGHVAQVLPQDGTFPPLNEHVIHIKEVHDAAAPDYFEEKARRDASNSKQTVKGL